MGLHNQKRQFYIVRSFSRGAICDTEAHKCNIMDNDLVEQAFFKFSPSLQRNKYSRTYLCVYMCTKKKDVCLYACTRMKLVGKKLFFDLRLEITPASF